MTTKRPDTFMPLVVGDYLKDTGHLTTEQHGAYLLLLMAYWSRGGALPADDERLAATARLTPQQWAKHKPVLSEFFTEEDGHWINKRSEEELILAQKKMDAKAMAGAKGASARWQTHGKRIATALRPHAKRDGKTHAEAMAKSCPSSSSSHTSPRGEVARPPVIFDFGTFYDAYPRQPEDPMGQAELAWDEVVSAPDFPGIGPILAALTRWKTARTLDVDPPFAPFAKTWLLEKRWLDWPEPPPPEPHKRDWAEAYPDTWGRLKASVTPNEWSFWLGKCTVNGPAHVLFAPDALTAEKVQQKFGARIAALFGEASIRVVGDAGAARAIQPKQEGTAA